MSEPAATQAFDLVLAGGRVLDERNGVDGVMDVAVKDGRIKRGDTVLMEALGGGFTWGAALVRY